MKDKKLLIITGVQRSGNTLLAKILGNHSKIKMEKDPSLTTIFNSHSLLKKNIKNTDLGDKQDIMKEIVSNFKYWHPERFDGFDFKNWNNNIFQKYIDYKIQDNHKIFLGSKIPDYCNRLEEIDVLANNVKYINVIRDPRNVVYSQMSKINTSLVEAVAFWKYSFFKSSYYSLIFGENKYLSIKYENLLINPKDEIVKVCNFLDIEFEETMLNLNDRETQEVNSYIIPYFDKSKLKAYRKNLSKDDILKIESYCLEEMISLDYKLDNENVKPNYITRYNLYINSLKKDFKNLFIANKMHMSNNKLNRVKVPFKQRFMKFLKTLSSFIIPNGVLEILISNNRLNNS